MMLNIAVFLVAVAGAFVTSFMGMGAVIGRDIGYAGAALWFVMLPAALIAVLLAYPISFRVSGTRLSRHGVFLVAAVALAWFLGAFPAAAWKAYMRADRPPPAPEEFVYVPGPDYKASIALKLPDTAVAGHPMLVKVERKAGPWQRVRGRDVKAGIAQFNVIPSV